MKKLSPIAYRALFFKHLYRFLGNVATGKALAGEHAVGVSGGMDSIALLWVANRLHRLGKIGSVRGIFIHHHTREGQDEDLEIVRKFCKEAGIPLKVLHAESLSPGMGNFEEKARKVRRELLLKEVRPNERLWLGHHLDDSYEWNLMQRHRSSNPRASIGIPVRHGPILRPFLCVTKAQIRRLVKFEGLEYSEDPTNFDLKHDRNYIRLKVVPPLKKRYPKYLKHYSQFANFSAKAISLNIPNRINESQVFLFDQGAVIKGVHFSQLQVQELIHTYSNTNRGEIVSQIDKMFRAIDKEKKGPFYFSGGILAYYSHHLLMIFSQTMKNYDESIAGVLSQLSDEELQELPTFTRNEFKRTWENLFNTSDAMLNMPGLVVVLESDSIRKTLNTSVYDVLFPLTSKVCKERGLRFTTASKCLVTWKTKEKKLPSSLRLLPLWSLSNLFSSQQ